MGLTVPTQKMLQRRHDTLCQLPSLTPYIIMLALESKDEVSPTRASTVFESRGHAVKLVLIDKLIVDRVCQHCQLSIGPALTEVGRRRRSAVPMFLITEGVLNDFLIHRDILVRVPQSNKIINTLQSQDASGHGHGCGSSSVPFCHRYLKSKRGAAAVAD